MSELVPENMREIRLAMLDLQDQGKPVDEDQLIADTIVEIFQIYIDNAEEGHYDTCKLTDRHQFQIIDVLGKPAQTFHSDVDVVERFKKNTDDLLFQLEDWAAEVAG